MNAPLISIITPCYNQSEYLTECLQSVVTQTVTDWEAIVVDDGSSDSDRINAIVESLNDNRICLVRHEQNRGLAAARNTGIRRARAAFVLPLDADDKLAPSYLENVGAALIEHPEYDCVFTDFFVFGIREKIVEYQVRDTLTLLSEQWIPGAGTTFKKSLWEKVDGYCEAKELRAGNEDWDFYLGAAEIGFVSGHISEPLYFYRKHRDSMVIRLGNVDFQTRIFMYYRHQQLFDRFGLGDSFVADGFRNSIAFSLQRGELPLAVNLVAQACRFSTGHRFGVLIIMLKAMIKDFIVSVRRKMYRLARSFKHKFYADVGSKD